MNDTHVQFTHTYTHYLHSHKHSNTHEIILSFISVHWTTSCSSDQDAEMKTSIVSVSWETCVGQLGPHCVRSCTAASKTWRGQHDSSWLLGCQCDNVNDKKKMYSFVKYHALTGNNLFLHAFFFFFAACGSCKFLPVWLPENQRLDWGVSYLDHFLWWRDHQQETPFSNQKVGCRWRCRQKALGKTGHFILHCFVFKVFMTLKG